MPQIIAARTTGQMYTETRNVRFVDDEMFYLDADQGPLLTLFRKLKNKKPSFSTKVEWFEDDYVARWTTSATTMANTTASATFTVTDGTLFAPGDLFVAPNAATLSTAPEIFRVTSISSNVLTVVRAQGGSSAQTVNSSAALRIIGNAYEENSVPVRQKVTSPTAKSTYLQLFRKPIYMSKEAIMSKHYAATGGELDREKRKKLIEHKIDINGQFLFGGASTEALTGGPDLSNPIRLADSLNGKISTNVVDGGGTLTRKGFESFSRTAFRYGKSTKLLLATPQLISALHDWGNSFMQVRPGETTFGVRLEEVEAGHGTWILVKDWMLEDGISGANGFSGWSFSVDIDSIEQYYLTGNGMSGDTSYYGDIIRDGRWGRVDEYASELGLKIPVEKRHAKLFNVTDYSA